MSERDTTDRAVAAAAEATRAAMEAGHGRSSKVTIDSAFAAADAVFRAERVYSAPPVEDWHSRIDRDFEADPYTGEVP